MIRKDKRRFSHVETWVFDLDNTLYPHHVNLWQQVDGVVSQLPPALAGLELGRQANAAGVRVVAEPAARVVRVAPKPPEPDTSGMTPYQAAKARDEWAGAMEAWDVRRLTRVLKAKRRRVERMRKKIPNQ